jgi:hypothetical protein
MEISAKRYVDKMIDTYVQLYGEKPRKASSPLEQNDHPEMDDSPFLGQDKTQQFQSLIGAMQWAVSIGRLDIATAVMSLSSFHAMPRRGHLKRAKQIYLLSSDKTRHSSSNHSLEPCNGQYRLEDLISRQP